eukprot:5179665-Prymnesium_polylepis.1
MEAVRDAGPVESRQPRHVEDYLVHHVLLPHPHRIRGARLPARRRWLLQAIDDRRGYAFKQGSGGWRAAREAKCCVDHRSRREAAHTRAGAGTASVALHSDTLGVVLRLIECLDGPLRVSRESDVERAQCGRSKDRQRVLRGIDIVVECQHIVSTRDNLRDCPPQLQLQPVRMRFAPAPLVLLEYLVAG